MNKAYRYQIMHFFLVKTWTLLDNLSKNMKVLFTYKE